MTKEKNEKTLQNKDKKENLHDKVFKICFFLPRRNTRFI